VVVLQSPRLCTAMHTRRVTDYTHYTVLQSGAAHRSVRILLQNQYTRNARIIAYL
jgi:hypothetical protein